MTTSGRDIPRLHVEGRDDLFAISNLLERRGLDMSEAKRLFDIVTAFGIDELLGLIQVAVDNATTHPVGFVLDTDVPVEERWVQVRDRLRKALVDAPDDCPSEGFIGGKEGYQHPVGVWLMPDCVTDFGMLEHLLQTLIPPNDKLWPHATKCTDEAQEIGVEFAESGLQKARIHCWLAWQQDPGCPFGTAIKAKFFGQDSPEASAFSCWLKKLYGIS